MVVVYSNCERQHGIFDKIVNSASPKPAIFDFLLKFSDYYANPTIKSVNPMKLPHIPSKLNVVRDAFSLSVEIWL